MLFVLPLRYEDRTHVVPIGALVGGMHAVVEGEVLLAEIVFRRRRQLLVRLADGSGSLTLRFFYFSNAQREALARGSRLRCHGEIRRGPLGLEIVHPEYRHIAQLSEPLPQTLTPIYPGTEGLTQGRLRMLVDRALRALDPRRDRAAARSAAQRLRLPELRAALEFMHRPPVGTELADARLGLAPGAAPPGVRGTARASPVAEGAASRHQIRQRAPPRRCLGLAAAPGAERCHSG